MSSEHEQRVPSSELESLSDTEHLMASDSPTTDWPATVRELALDLRDCRAALAESQARVLEQAEVARTFLCQTSDWGKALRESQERAQAHERLAAGRLAYFHKHVPETRDVESLDNAIRITLARLAALQQQHDALRSELDELMNENTRRVSREDHNALRSREASLRRQVGEALKDAHMWMAALCGRMHADESCHPKALKNAQDATEKVRILLAAMEREAASGEPTP